MHPSHSGPPSDLVALIVADLARELGRPPGDVQVRSVEAVTWRDGSLGCPEPGMFYTQALVPGFRLTLEVDGRSFDYRSGRGMAFRRCNRSDKAGAEADPLPEELSRTE